MLSFSRFSAAKEIRTPTPFRALPPQSSASTSFAIAAALVKPGVLRLYSISGAI